MNCFYHSTVPAVAICKNCSRGLCPGCAVDIINGTACINRCEQAVRDLVDLIDHNKRMAKKVASVHMGGAWIFSLLGIALIVMAVLSSRAGYLYLVLALVMFFGAFISYLNAKKLR